MGANAQTTVPTFTTGQVLTADQMNQSARTGVPVFADTTARDAGFGGAGEKTLAEGQLCYLESTNVVQYYDGAVWATVGPVAPALTFVTGATFTTASAVTVDNVFTSTYENYLMIFIISALTNTADTTMGMRVGGATNTTANYARAQVGLDTAGSASNNAGSGGTSWNLGSMSSTEVDAGFVMNFIRPQLATRTSVITSTWESVDGQGRQGPLFFQAATAFDGFTIIRGTGTMTGNYRIYGYSNS